jgi:hypothetical protein
MEEQYAPFWGTIGQNAPYRSQVTIVVRISDYDSFLSLKKQQYNLNLNKSSSLSELSILFLNFAENTLEYGIVWFIQ